MKYYFKPPASEQWVPLETSSLTTEVSRGNLKWNWQIKWADGTHEMTVGDMINPPSSTPSGALFCFILILVFGIGLWSIAFTRNDGFFLWGSLLIFVPIGAIVLIIGSVLAFMARSKAGASTLYLHVLWVSAGLLWFAALVVLLTAHPFAP